MITAVLLLLLGLLLIGLIIAANGYFVAQEFAYMSVDRSRLRAAADAGDESAKRALDVTKRTSFMLSGAQLGITVTGLMVGFVAEPFVGEGLGTLLGAGGVSVEVGVAVGTVAALILASIVQMIFGELFPKNLAIASPEPLAKTLARSTKLYLAAFGWLISFFDMSSNAVLRLLRVEPVHDVDSSATAEDLGHIIGESRTSGDLPDELSILLDRILDFPARDVEHAMVPRARVGVVRPDTSIAQMWSLMSSGHTRYPVLGAQDEPLGVIHLSDVLLAGSTDERPVSTLMRSPLVVPTLMPLPDALERLTASKNELACVIDEYGGFSGVLTVEDLAEELVGEISDEHDKLRDPGAEVAGDDVWLMDGDLPLDEAERILGRSLPRGDFETVAGLIIAGGGVLPEPGDRVSVALPHHPADMLGEVLHPRWLVIEVAEVERYVPSLLRVQLPPPGSPAPDGAQPMEDHR
ncbi:MAG: HlyC/CorC family transporter [Solirubrobacteraceae bacterium]|nr:HlyC/CorC family transporter [Solirubrobacteraceae bacterium]